MEPVSSQCDHAQVRQLFYDFEVLVPAVQLVLVKVEIHGTRNELTNFTYGANI